MSKKQATRIGLGLVISVGVYFETGIFTTLFCVLTLFTLEAFADVMRGEA